MLVKTLVLSPTVSLRPPFFGASKPLPRIAVGPAGEEATEQIDYRHVEARFLGDGRILFNLTVPWTPRMKELGSLFAIRIYGWYEGDVSVANNSG